MGNAKCGNEIMKSIVTGECRLCSRQSPLLESHIIPKFAIRWTKVTGTSYLRGIETPNLRLQDGIKERLLCAACEQLFATRESYFAAHIFTPMLASVSRIQYDDRLVYFIVSLLWRALQKNLQEARDMGYEFVAEIEKAETEWRQFLLGRRTLDRFDHFHVFVADLSVGNPPGVPKFNLYCSRAFDATFFDLEERCYVVVKFARFFFIGVLTQYNESDWRGTRITNGSGTLSVPQVIKDRAFGGWLMARAKFAFETFDSTISSNQLRVIREHVRHNLPRLRNSDLFRVAMTDQIDHESVVKRSKRVGRNDECPCGSRVKFKKCHGRPL